MMRSLSVRDNVVLRIITRDGKLKYLRNTSNTRKVEGGSVVIGTLQDISNDITLSDALREKNTALEQTNQELSSFNYVASHDLQEPVRKILTFAGLVRDKAEGPLGEAAGAYLERISAAAKRMQHLIEAFLNYSHLNSVEIRFEKVDLNEILSELRSNLAEELENTGAQLTSVPLPAVNGIRIQLQQLFINLVANALKYRKPGQQPVISITVKEVPGLMANFPGAIGDARYWRISVADNGIGFEPQYSEKIFEVFLRLHTKDKYEGTGIGLAICRKIVAAHKGFIRAEGEPGNGAVFHIYLPKTE
jgi:light-regulated signal transduction histidine kinase (bacteriophytochrome)